jgi:hypothetical protein
MQNTSSTTATPTKLSKAEKNKKLPEKGQSMAGFMDRLDLYEDDFHCQYGF